LSSNKEKRTAERYSLELPGQVSVISDDGDMVFEVTTRDVCAGGAFLYTHQLLPVGTRVKIEMILTVEQLKKIAGTNALLKVSGQVIRTEGTGMAVSFDKDYHLGPLPEINIYNNLNSLHIT